jgi:hypothetical protein
MSIQRQILFAVLCDYRHNPNSGEVIAADEGFGICELSYQRKRNGSTKK